MKKIILVISLTIAAINVFANNNSEAKKMFNSCKQKMTLTNVSMILDLETFDKKGSKKDKTLVVSYAQFDLQKKVLIEFIAPEIITGTKIVTTDYSNKRGLIEIYSPATGRVQKIKANKHNLKIMGSKIPISQFGPSVELNFNFTYLGEELFNGINIHKIKMDKPDEKGFLIAYISTVDEYLLLIQKYDMPDRLVSSTEFSDYLEVNSTNTKVYPKKISIVNYKTAEKTNIVIREINMLNKIDIDDFKLEATNL